MSWLRKLFGVNGKNKPRVRVCGECGMPVAEHKEWCAIFLTQQEMAQKRAQAVSTDS